MHYHFFSAEKRQFHIFIDIIENCQLPISTWNTASDLFSGHGYSGNDGFSGTKTPDDAILFTVSGITAIVEQKFRKFRFFPKNFDTDLGQVSILKLIKL